MAQSYLGLIEELGEAALAFFGGEFSHAVTKGAMLADQRELVAGLYKQEVITPRVASADEMSVARLALSAVPRGAAQLAYARVDLVPDVNGSSLLIELELDRTIAFSWHRARLSRSFGSAARITGLKFRPVPRCTGLVLL